MASILRSVRFLLNCCCVQIHNVFRSCVSYLPQFSLSSIQFGTTTTKQIAGNITKKGQPKEKMGRRDRKKNKPSGAKTASVSLNHQVGSKRPPEASPPDQIAAKRASPPTNAALFETSSESPTTSSQTTKPNELSEYQQADQNSPLSAGEIRHVEEKQSEASAEHAKPEVFSTEPPSTEPSASNLPKKRRRNRKGRKDSQGTDEVKSETLVGRQHEPIAIEKPQQVKQEATPEPIFKVSPTQQKSGDEQLTDKHGEQKDIKHERRHIKDEDMGRNSKGKHPNQQNKKPQIVQQLEPNASIPDSKSADVSQLDVKPIETSPKKSTFKQPNATTSQKTTPEKQSKQKPQPEPKDVFITSELLDKILISPEKSQSAEKSNSEDKQSLRPEEVKVQKSDQIETTKRSFREKSGDRPSREKSGDRPSREKSGDRSSRERSNDRASTTAFVGRISAEQRNESRDDNHEARYIPSPRKETQRGEDRGKEQGPTKGERLPDGGRSNQRHWDDDDDVMELRKEDDKEPRSDRDRKQDQPQEPEKQYRNQEDQGFQRVQRGRGGQQRGRGRGRGADDRLQPNLDNWVGGQRGNRIGNRDGHQNDWRDNRGGHEGGQRGRDQDNWRGYQDNQRGYQDNQRGYQDNQRGNRGGQRGGRGRGFIVDVPLRQPDVLPPFLKEVEGDLFSCDDHVSLVHCVSADFVMGKGIAVDFKKRFSGVQELKAQRKGPGNVAFLKRHDRYIYYMVTKSEYFKKPSYKSMGSSLNALKTMVLDHKVTELAMPRIGSGLDLLDWNIVLDMILDTFKDSKVNITVYVYKP